MAAVPANAANKKAALSYLPCDNTEPGEHNKITSFNPKIGLTRLRLKL
jgi:hypothetical protein